MSDLKFFTKHYVSLGQDCHPALYMRRFGLRKKAFPFDWISTPDFDVVTELIGNRFTYFHDYEHLTHYADKIKGRPHLPFTMKHSLYGILFGHDYKKNDFHKNILSRYVHHKIKAKYNRRIERFYRMMKETGNQVVFCRRQRQFSRQAEALDKALKETYPNLKVHIFVYIVTPNEFVHLGDVSRVSYYNLENTYSKRLLCNEGWKKLFHLMKECVPT